MGKSIRSDVVVGRSKMGRRASRKRCHGGRKLKRCDALRSVIRAADGRAITQCNYIGEGLELERCGEGGGVARDWEE